MIRLFVMRLAQTLFSNPGLPTPNADQDHLRTIVNIFFGILGSVAVLIITIAGFRFVIHQGDPGDTVKARNSIIYAVVGLVVALSAWVIVSFVIGQI